MDMILFGLIGILNGLLYEKLLALTATVSRLEAKVDSLDQGG